MQNLTTVGYAVHLKQYLSLSFILSAYVTGIESVKLDQSRVL